MKTLLNIQLQLREKAVPQNVEILQRFFKTGKGQYGEGDIFIGVKIPLIRDVAKKNLNLPWKDLSVLISSKIHEDRMLALLILVLRYKKADPSMQEEIVSFYLKNLKYINNWDLVDLSAQYILGHYYFDKDRTFLNELASDDDLFKRRIAIIASFYFIKNRDFSSTFFYCENYYFDKRDLIQKALGWMLREIGNRDFEAEIAFLNLYYKKFPRTMLRYAIEKFPEELRQQYLKGKI